jgi:hypothetical protein
MKLKISALCFLGLLCVTTAAFGQTASVMTSQAQPLQIPDHPMHASEHSMASETSLFGSSPYSYAKGEVPLSELGSPIYHTPLGDLAREARKEHASLPKATKTFQN